MLKTFVILFFIGNLFIRCTYFNFKKENKEQLLDKQWNALVLEKYPEIRICKQMSSKQCFESQIVTHFNKYFSESFYSENEIKKDTLWLVIKVTNKGELSVNYPKKIKTIFDIDFIDNQLTKACLDISPIKPAYIRGVPVNCNFKLPFVIGN